VKTTLPDSTVRHKKYTAAGHLWKEWGSQSYPMRYSYDEQGRMKTLETFRGNTTNAEPPDTGGSADVTTWNYHAATGKLSQKVYADSSELNYGYSTDNGFLTTRTWARTPGSQLLVTTYRYTVAGELLSVDYSDTTTTVLGTPEVLYHYNRAGQLDEVKDGQLASPGGASMSTTRYTHTYSWNGLQPNQETITAIHHQTKVLTRKYQTNVGSNTLLNRSAGYEIGVSTDTDQDFAMTYGYDTSGRISTVTDPNDTFTYGYVSNAPGLISTMTGPHHTATRTYDPYRDILATLTNTETVGTASDISKYTYTVNSIGQRTDIVRVGSAFALGTSPMNTHFDHIGYNTTGEVTATDRYSGGTITNTGSPITGFDYDWTFDGIGNRNKSSVSSTKVGYVAANTNKYTKTFNDTDGDGIQDTGETDISNPTHDLDGNMTQDADYDYTYDTENRLIQRTPRTPSSGKLQLTFSYDYLGRRVRILSKYHTGSAWASLYDETILYDGWNPVMHYSYDFLTANPWRKRSYTWGLDVTGSFQGAGGVGGLLAVTGWLVRGSTAYDTLRYYYTYDGNGNVSEIINYNNFNAYSVCAHFEYDAFGNLTRLDDSGGWSIARTSPFRFSTKWHDNAHLYEENGTLNYTLEPSKLYYYGYRYFSPQYGRWLNRDPMEEVGGNNLYCAVSNGLVNQIDFLGLSGSPSNPAHAFFPPGETPGQPVIPELKPQPLYPTITATNMFGKCYCVKVTQDQSKRCMKKCGVATMQDAIDQLWNPESCYFKCLTTEVQRACDLRGTDDMSFQEELEWALENVPFPMCGMRGGSPRGRTARPDGTNNPFKKMKPHPTDPGKVIYKDANGKDLIKAKPPGFDDWFNK
jgi:RHS repeat-associated protein